MSVDKFTAIVIAVLIILSGGLGYYIGSSVAPRKLIQEYTHTTTIRETEVIQVATPITQFITITYPPYTTTYTTTLTYAQTQVVEKTLTVTLTTTSTLTQLLTVTLTPSPTTVVPTPTPRPGTTGLRLGGRIGTIMPFLYKERNVYYREDMNTVLDRWNVEGLYEVRGEGLRLVGGEGSCSVAVNRAYSLRSLTTFRIRLGIENIGSIVKISLVRRIDMVEVVSLNINNTYNTHILLQGSTPAYHRSVNIKDVKEIELLFVHTTNALEIYIKRIGRDAYWVLLTQMSSGAITSLLTFSLSACNSSIVLKEFVAYEVSGHGLRDIRPIYDWSNGKYDPRSFLTDSEGYMLFAATECFHGYGWHILLMRTKDLVNFEPIRTIVTGYTGQPFLFKWVDGKIHGFLMDWGSLHQNGLHRIIKVEFDENFKLLRSGPITLVNAPPGGDLGHYDIAILKFNGSWYALTASFSGGTILWSIRDPTDSTLVYLKTIFPNGHENPYIVPVLSPDNKVLFMLSIATDTRYGARHRIYILDQNFNPIEYYDLLGYRIWTAGISFYLDPWYVLINQDQIEGVRFRSNDLGTFAFAEIYRLITNYRYYIEEG